MLVWPILSLAVVIATKDAIYDEMKGCLAPNRTYIINVHSHIQSEVRNALVSLAFQLGGIHGDQIQGSNGESAAALAIRSYLGTVIEELNKDLDNFNIQVNLVFDEQEINQISANGAYDPSCELGPAVVERTNNAMVKMRKDLNNAIGFHLFVFGCIFKNPKHDLINVIRNENCGRVIGIMWDGSVASKTLIKSAIIEALTGAKDAYANGYLTLADKNILCGFFEKCIGMSPTVHGQLLNIRKRIQYTKGESEEHHPLTDHN